jgi:hypothetical protein
MVDISRSRLTREVDLLYKKDLEDDIDKQLYARSLRIYNKSLVNKKTSDTLIILSLEEKYNEYLITQNVVGGITRDNIGKNLLTFIFYENHNVEQLHGIMEIRDGIGMCFHFNVFNDKKIFHFDYHCETDFFESQEFYKEYKNIIVYSFFPHDYNWIKKINKDPLSLCFIETIKK